MATEGKAQGLDGATINLGFHTPPNGRATSFTSQRNCKALYKRITKRCTSRPRIALQSRLVWNFCPALVMKTTPLEALARQLVIAHFWTLGDNVGKLMSSASPPVTGQPPVLAAAAEPTEFVGNITFIIIVEA